MPQLPQFQTTDRVLGQMQNTWASILNPFLINPANTPVLLRSISLTTGSNSINHLLGKPLIGWNIVRQRSSATFYDSQDANPTPEVTLTLVSSASCVVDIQVY